MRYFILLCYFTFQFTVLHAQDYINTSYYYKGATEILLRYEDILGSPYIYEKFNTGDVYFVGKDTAIKYQLNYNAYVDAVDFLKDNKVYTVTNHYEIKKIYLNNSIIVYANYYSKNSISKGFFIEIIDNSVSLYKKETVAYVPAKSSNFLNSKNNGGEFKRLNPQYYISILGRPAFQVKNKRNIISEFSNNQVVIDYLKKEKNNVNSEDDLKKFAEYLNNYRTK